MTTLIIAEKKLVAEAIKNTFGGNPNGRLSYKLTNGNLVTWLSGHLLEFVDPEDKNPALASWNINDLPLMWDKEYKIIKGRSDHVKTVVELARSSDNIIHAGDPDAEGQRLVDELLEYGKLAGRPCQRVLINDNNPAAIKRAFDKLQDNKKFAGLSQSAYARAVGDMTYGYNLTRLYTLAGRKKGLDGVLSVGRAQTPILGLVVARTRAHYNFEKVPFYQVVAGIASGNEFFPGIYLPTENDSVDESNRILDKAVAEKIAAEVKKTHSGVIESVKTINKSTPPPLPYNLLVLQGDASKKFNYDPSETLAITQSLRDKHSAITYNRSDSRYLNDDHHDDAPELLKKLTQQFPAAKNACSSNKSKAFNSEKVTAHHAIIPTESVPNLDKLSEKERNVYQLIANLYIAQFYPHETYKVTTVITDFQGKKFESKGRVDVQAGWRVLFSNDDEKAEKRNLEELKKDNPVSIEKIEVLAKETKPKPLYTMSTLLLDLAQVAKYVTDPRIKSLLLAKDDGNAEERGGIGTPATRASLIDTLLKRTYIEKVKGKVVSTELGNSFHDSLPGEITRPDQTALWAEIQEKIENGNGTANDLIGNVNEFVNQQIEQVKTHGLNIKVKGHVCHNCGSLMNKRTGKNGAFWGCSGYPDCKTTLPDDKGKPGKPKPKLEVSHTHKCPDCDSGLIRRPSTKNKEKFWWGCSGFPKCKNTFFDDNNAPKIPQKSTSTS